jgi:hypothetical protein
MGAKNGQAAAPYGVPLRYGELDRVKLQIAVIAGINDEFSFLTLFSRVDLFTPVSQCEWFENRG